MNIDMLWRENERWVFKLIHDFQRRWGGDFGELLSDAFMGFTKAAEHFDPARGRMTTLLSFVVPQTLAAEREKRERHPCAALPREIESEKDQRFFSELSADARLVLNQLLPLSGLRPRGLRRRAAETLAELEWTGSRIAETLAEIKSIIYS